MIARPLCTLGLVSLLGLAGACDPAGPRDSKLSVAATTTMVGDLVRQIAGDRVRVTVLMGPGVDPHTFKPSTADLGALRQADLVFYNGLHLEGKMVELFEQNLADRAVAASRDVPESQLLAWQEGQGGAHDPHIWFDAQLWARAAQTVCDVLASRDPGNAEHYKQRAQQVTAELQQLDHYVREQIARIPESRRVLITSHDAYNYFGKAYGIEVRGLQGISTESEAGISNINSAVEFILARQIPAVFVETSVSPKTIQRVRDDCTARGVDVKLGGELYSDAMGAPGEHPGYAVETYAGMFRYNVDTIVKALK